MKNHKILLYNKPWGMNNEVNGELIEDGYELTTDRRVMNEALAVIFHMPGISRDDKILDKCMKKDGQLWVFWTMECEVHYQWQWEPAILDLFDITATYKMNSTIPVPYLYSHYPEIIQKAPATKCEFINAFISSNFNQSNRIGYLQQLMTYIDIHSYGKTLNNKQLANDKGFDTKNDIISAYKFTLAFENAIAPDYVTEKFFEPLIAGSVPVYLGAPNIEDFAPGNKCYINVNSFSSVKSLADYLLELNNNDEKYQEYLAWKNLPLRESFIRKASFIGDGSPLLKLCRLLKKIYNKLESHDPNVKRLLTFLS